MMRVKPASKKRTQTSTLKRLREELAESQEALRAIRSGEVDALVISSKDGDQIFTLKSADQSYRVLVESMNEGALMLLADSTIIYSNRCFSEFIQKPLQETIGKSVFEFISASDQDSFKALFKKALSGQSKGEIALKNFDGAVCVMISLASVQMEMGPGVTAIVTDITEQKRLEASKRDVEQLRLANESSEAALLGRDEFLTIASHELKTPITSLKLQLELAWRRLERSQWIPTNQELQSLFKVSIQQVKRLTILVEDLLDISKIQAGRVQYHVEALNLSELFSEMSSRFNESWVEAGNDIEVKIPASIDARWDRSRIEQVFVNLITNAVKYALGARIIIVAEMQQDEVLIKVSDNGPGIASTRLSFIFERFERATSSRNISGLGLGLFIVKSIVESHGGEINVASDIGKGTTFSIRLPINAENFLNPPAE